MSHPGTTVRRRVEFAETDMAGIVHFTRMLQWIEAAEAAWFREAGLPLIDLHPERLTGWPRVRVNASFSAPATFGDVVEVTLRLVEIKLTALVWEAEVHRLVPPPGAALPESPEAAAALPGTTRERLAKVGMVTAHARRDPATGAIRSESLPPESRARIEARLS